MKKICVFCGSSPGTKPEYSAAAVDLGATLAGNDIGLVYGGGNVGMMGLIANAVLEKGGNVVGVVPRFLADKEVAMTELADLRIVDSMHERKALMADLSDAFIALPGGLGTLEEFIEVLTWAQLGIHQKPCGVLNICGYFDTLLSFLDHMVEQKFVEKEHRQMVLVDDNPDPLLEKLESFVPPNKDKAAWALRMNHGLKQT